MKKILCFLLTAMLLLTSAVILPVAADDAAEPTTETTTYTAPIYYGAQAGTGTTAGTQKIRFISLVPENVGKTLGYEIVVTYGENVVRYGAAQGDANMESNVVYTSLIANNGYGNEVVTTAAVAEKLGVEKAYGLFVVVIDNIPVDAQFDVRTYVKEDAEDPEDKSGCTSVTLATGGVIGTAAPADAWATQGGNGTAAYPYVLNQKNFVNFYNAKKATGQYSELKVYCELESDIVVNDNWSAAGGTVPSIAWYAPLSYPSGVSFEGNGHTISGIYIKNTIGAANTGLFSEVQSSTISNLNIRNSYFEAANPSANKMIGSIAGYANNSTVRNCFSDAIVVSSCDNNGAQSVGGIIGQLNGSSNVLNCVFAGSITAARTRVGGVVGYIGWTSGNTVSNCLNLGSVDNMTYSSTSGLAGGIMGWCDSGGNTISNCINLSKNISGREKTYDVSGGGSQPTNSYTVEGYCVGSTESGLTKLASMDALCALDLDGWYYVDGYLPSPIEGLLIPISSAE